MKKLIVAISGASGMPIAVKLLQILQQIVDIEVHLIVSRWGKITLQQETDYDYQTLCQLATVVYNNHNLGASIASGSFKTNGMIVVPCSMKTLATIRAGLSDNLIARAADVILKERRKLLLVTREAPLNAIHLENMLALTQMGGIIFPPTITFYQQPVNIEQIIEQIVIRILDQFDIEHPAAKRWQGLVNTYSH